MRFVMLISAVIRGNCQFNLGYCNLGCISGYEVNMSDKEEKKDISVDDIKFMNVLLTIPENSVQVIVNVKTMENGEIVGIVGTYGPKDIREIRSDFLEAVPDGDDWNAVYTLTDEGQKYVDKYLKK